MKDRSTSKRTEECGPHAAERPHVAEVSDSAFERAAALFRAAGDLARLRLLHRLDAGECCVTELADARDTKLSTLSQQLRVLHAERIVKRRRDGSEQTLTASDGKELVAGGRIIIPPGESTARRYKEVLGTHRLNLGDGYALHGTNAPGTIGRSVSHGCVRLRNEDIETLYKMIPVGAAVYIY